MSIPYTRIIKDPFTPGREIHVIDSVALTGVERGDPRHFERPVLHLSEAGDGPVRIGGAPRASAGASWPRSRFGNHRFIAEIDFADLALRVPIESRPDVPADGVLALFHAEAPGDVRSDELEGFVAWELVYTARTADAVPMDPPDGMPLEEPRRFGVRPGREGPHPSDLLACGAGSDYLGSYPNAKLPDHKLFGHAAWVQSDERLIARLESNGIPPTPKGIADALTAGRDLAAIGREAMSWQLLLQLDPDDRIGVTLSDYGLVYLLVPPADSREGRFDRAMFIIQCG